MAHTNLTELQIRQLINQGCMAQDWGQVLVESNFSCQYVRNVNFMGEVRLASFGGMVVGRAGVPLQSGVYNVTLSDCSVGRDSLVENVTGLISNYDIGQRCYISGVGSMTVQGLATFGNGVRAMVLNETGGRQVALFDELSSQMAYMMAMYQYREQLVTELYEMVDRYAQTKASCRGKVADGASIVSVTSIRDVEIGAAAQIIGALNLENGTICSSPEAPTFVGHGVWAKDFVVARGAKVDSGATLVRSFVGEASNLSHGFSAHDSLFFSNSICENGEACAVFAGPYTVSMHKSTLMIGGMFSFSNFGSGSNQSNHLYKLGPVHQGVMERGVKFSSDSYVMFPAHIGAFTMVMGRHSSHPDTSALPFSYLLESEGESHLVPAINLVTSGTIRDAQKWPKRDARLWNEPKLDTINSTVLNPFTAHRMVDAIKELKNIIEASGRATHTKWHGCKIKLSAASRGIDLYSKALDKYLVGKLVGRLVDRSTGKLYLISTSLTEHIAELLNGPSTPFVSQCGQGVTGNWIDMAGAIVPKSLIEELVVKIEKQHTQSPKIEHLTQQFAQIQQHYDDLEWQWVRAQILSRWNLKWRPIVGSDIKCLIESWLRAVQEIDSQIYQDAAKEFDPQVSVGFGVDAILFEENSARIIDFSTVRGKLTSNNFATMVQQHSKDCEKTATTILDQL